MDQKELKIQIPEGYKIDRENSTFEKIVFKKKEDPKTYEEVADLLLRNRNGFRLNSGGNILPLIKIDVSAYCPDVALKKEQLEWLLALNKLQNVANYLNDGWVPDWDDSEDQKYIFWYNHKFNEIQIDYFYKQDACCIYFKSRELAEKAIEILGEEVVKTALGIYKGC